MDVGERSGLPWDRHLQNRWNDKVCGFILKDFKNKNDMYRNFVAQHGYEPIGSEPRTVLKILHSFYIILTEGSDRNLQKQEC